MQAYLWKGISAQHVLCLLGGLSVIPARFCADSEICIGTNAYKKVKGLLPLASLNKCLHDLAKEQKVAPMVVECVNCEYYCHEGDANLPFDQELSDIKISLRLENKLHHMLRPDVMCYGSRMAQVSMLDHEGSGDKWVLFYCYRRFQSDGSYSDKRILQHCQPLVEYNLNVNWNDNCCKPILAMELKTSGKTLLLSHQKKQKTQQEGLTNKHCKKMAMQEEHIMDIALNGENYCSAIHRRQRYFVAGALVRMRGARMFTPQMIAGSMQKEGTYHFFEIKGTALSLMVPNVGSKWKQKKDAVNTFKVSTSGGLVTFTTKIFGIPLMKHS
jgi:hypothetical protein